MAAFADINPRMLKDALDRLNAAPIPSHGEPLVGDDRYAYDQRFDDLGSPWQPKYIKQRRSL